MDHIALDRPGPDNRDLDHQIVEAARAQPREHVHLRAAFDLKHAERVPLAQHVVNLGVLARDARQCQVFAVMCAQQIEAFADAGQHAERQHIDLEDAERVDIILVPLDKAAFWHRAVANRHSLGQRTLRENKPADMLGKVARHADQLLSQREHPAQVRIAKVQPGFAVNMCFLDRTTVPAPHCFRERTGDIFG